MADDYLYLDEVDVNGSTFIQFKPISTRTLEDVIKGDQEQEDIDDNAGDTQRKSPPPVLPKPKRKKPSQARGVNEPSTSSTADTQTRLRYSEVSDTFDRVSTQSGDDDDSGIEGSAYQGSEPPPDDIAERLSHQIHATSEASLTPTTDRHDNGEPWTTQPSHLLEDVISDNQFNPTAGEEEKPTESFMAEMCLASTLPSTFKSKSRKSKPETLGRNAAETRTEASSREATPAGSTKRISRSHSVNVHPNELGGLNTEGTWSIRSTIGKPSRCAALVRSIDAILDESLDRLKPSSAEPGRPVTPTAGNSRMNTLASRRLSLNQTDRKAGGHTTDHRSAIRMHIVQSPPAGARPSFSEADSRTNARLSIPSSAQRSNSSHRYNSPRRQSMNEQHLIELDRNATSSLNDKVKFVAQLDTTISGRPVSHGMSRHRSVSPSVMSQNHSILRNTSGHQILRDSSDQRRHDRGERSQNVANEKQEQRGRVVVPTTLLTGRGFSISRDSSGNVCVQANRPTATSESARRPVDERRPQTPRDKPAFVFHIRKSTK